MRILTLSAALIATTLSSAAVAADWVLVTTNVVGNVDYIERESIRTMPNGYKRAWQRTIYGEPDDALITTVMAYGEYDCSEGRRRILQLMFYKDKEVDSTINSPSDWSYVAPGTTEELVFNFVCFGKLD